MPAETTALEAEIAKFDALAERWWDPDGPMAPLHRMNPLRCGWIARRLAAAEGRQGEDLTGLTLLDVGCGAGLASEGMARLGARVTGLDAAGTALEAARAHATSSGLEIDYRQGRPEELAAEGARFDAVIALEVIEHVADRHAFLAALASVTKPGGHVFLSTLNRTPKSFLFAKVGAEYLLRLLPRGTHSYENFIKPSELAAAARRAGLSLTELAGMEYNPITDIYKLSRDTSVNYLVATRREA